MPLELNLASDGEEAPRRGHQLDYLPFGLKTLRLTVDGDFEGKVRLRPRRMSAVAGETFGHEDSGVPPQFIISWGGGHEGHCEIDNPRVRMVHLLVHHVGEDLGDHLLTIEASDEAGQAVSLPLLLTYPRSGGIGWPADRLAKSTWTEVTGGLGGACSIDLRGDFVPRYLARWWPSDRVIYSYDKSPPSVRLYYQRLVDGVNGALQVHASRPGDAQDVLLAEIRGSIAYPLYDMRQVLPELFRFGPQTWVLRVWFFWLDLEVSRQDLARYWARTEDELEQAWRGITGKEQGGTSSQAWRQMHEIPDAERVDIVFTDELQPLYAATDLHWRELWGQYAPQSPGEPIQVQIMNTRAKDIVKNWRELAEVVRGWGQIILNRFANQQPPYMPHREVMAELRGEGVLAADPIGMESHSPAFMNVRIQRHLTSTDVRTA
jgi:hypothetical protein